jgi:hypothetical protein
MDSKLVNSQLDPSLVQTLLGVSVNESFKDDEPDSSSSLTSPSSGSASQATVVKTECIPLALANWEKRAVEPVSKDQSKVKAQELIQFFLTYGLQQLAPESHPIQILKKALEEMGAVYPKERDLAIRRVAHNRLNAKSYTGQLRDFIFNDMPVFNIWDSIALIYTISIEDIFCDREAELYEYQLKLITKAARATGWWSGDYVPATSQGAWTLLPNKNGRFLVAFAFSCIGGKKSGLRTEQNLARQDYNSRLHNLVQLSDTELRALDHGNNKAGNCPEYLTWGTICKGPGNFKSLCLSNRNQTSLRYCGPCGETARMAEANLGIVIQDIWNTCTLARIGGKGEKQGHVFDERVESTAEIIAQGRGHNVVKRRG